MTTTLSFTAACDQQMVAAEVASQRTIEWSLTVPDVAQHTRRAPLNIALILDRSGSMSGDKLRYVQQASAHLLDLLDERDRVAVVAYDDQVKVVATSAPVNEQVRRELKERINALTPGGWTDLSSGWLAGCQEIAGRLSSEGINRALLLTDGLANRGILDVEELGHHAAQLRKRGIATSTFGVGLDFNEQLLELVAERGGGHFYYIAQPAQIPEVFRRELGELLTVVAREAFVRIAIPAGVAVELLGALAHERDGGQLRIFLGDLCAGERRLFYTRVLTPPDAPGTALVVRAELGYANLEGHTTVVNAEQTFSYARQAEVVLLPAYAELLTRASEVEVAAAATEALRLERAGQRTQAQHLMRQTLASAAPHMPAPAAAAYEQLTQQMQEGLSEEQRKATHFAAYQKRQSRG